MRVAVIGGGIGGAELVRLASQYPLDLVLIEPKDQIECQALYPEYLAGLAKVDELTAPLKPFCDKVRVELVRDRAVSLGLRSVVCEKIEVEYDVAVIATGAAQNYFGVKGAHETFSINTFEETVRARKFMEESDPERIMIIGSGLTGI